MSIQEQDVLRALAGVPDPNTGRDFVSGKQVRDLRIEGGQVSFTIELGYPALSQAAALQQALQAAVRQVAGVQDVAASVRSKIIAHAAQRGVPLLPGVKNIIGVASGKGGVGKSTVAANLALALAAEGARTGLLDADIHGPSQHVMMGLQDGCPESTDGKTMNPLRSHGVQVMSIGFLVERDEALIMRGPMASQAMDQLLRQTAWDDLDYLVVDLPPGTGDIQLTLSQRTPLTGALIVTTPQDIALVDARRAVAMFGKVNVPVLGLVENMAMYTCPQCGHTEHIFGADGGKKMAEELGLDALGALPLSRAIREQADSGCPTVAADPGGEVAAIYKTIARRVALKIADGAKDFSSKLGNIAVMVQP
ncbi:MAG: iron-sulfur cluster carrier protein ApbC [Burkholderiaceae bacterium]|jgi:ATP-binding protein involved in chromosome partitioning|nr:iron-sulfur cluster carrier protein ApbC [Burkholderiaceae bacterium]